MFYEDMNKVYAANSKRIWAKFNSYFVSSIAEFAGDHFESGQIFE